MIFLPRVIKVSTVQCDCGVSWCVIAVCSSFTARSGSGTPTGGCLGSGLTPT